MAPVWHTFGTTSSAKLAPRGRRSIYWLYGWFCDGREPDPSSPGQCHRAGQGVCHDCIPEIDGPRPVEPMTSPFGSRHYFDGEWHTFGARNTAQSSAGWSWGEADAVDMALVTSFGPVTLTEFEVRASWSV